MLDFKMFFPFRSNQINELSFHSVQIKKQNKRLKMLILSENERKKWIWLMHSCHWYVTCMSTCDIWHLQRVICFSCIVAAFFLAYTTLPIISKGIRKSLFSCCSTKKYKKFTIHLMLHSTEAEVKQVLCEHIQEKGMWQKYLPPSTYL